MLFSTCAIHNWSLISQNYLDLAQKYSRKMTSRRDTIDEEVEDQITSVSSYLKTINANPGGMRFPGSSRPGSLWNRNSSGTSFSNFQPPLNRGAMVGQGGSSGDLSNVTNVPVTEERPRGSGSSRLHGRRVSNSIKDIQGMLRGDSVGHRSDLEDDSEDKKRRVHGFLPFNKMGLAKEDLEDQGISSCDQSSSSISDNVSCSSSEASGGKETPKFASKFVNRVMIDNGPSSGSSNISTSSGGSVTQPPVAAVPAAPRNVMMNKEPVPEVNGSGRKYSSNSVSSAGERLSSAVKPATEIKEEPQQAIKKLKQLEGYVGFANLPNQVYRKAVKKGFEFTLMVVGESGLGKSTLVNSMFLTDIYSSEYPGPSARLKKTVQVDTSKVLLKESGVNLNLTIVDTPGFGDAVDNSDCWDPVISYVENQYEAFLDAETRVNRVALPDSRVHACLYFIAPSGHGLKPLDVEFMKRLHDKVNIIPVIGKSDTMTPEEIAHFKKQIMNQIAKNKIRIYEFPDDIGPSVLNGHASPEDERERRENRKLKDRVPFAVVGSNAIIDGPDERKIRGRKYPWGVVDIENLDHCDFVPLRNMLIRSHLQDLKEVTNNVHYENFRCRKLAGVAGGTMEKIPNRNPMAQIEEERREHEAKMSKMEREMEEVFERKVREKGQKLADSKEDLEKRNRESREKLEQQKKDLEAKMAAFEQEKLQWEQVNRITVDELTRLSMESLEKQGKKKGRVSKSRLLNGK